MESIEIYEVGGSLRDLHIKGERSGDRDHCVVASSFDVMRYTLNALGYEIKHEIPERHTLKCKNPIDGQVDDFVLCRTGEKYINGTLVYSEPGSLFQDLERRDFTINAIARNILDQVVVDYFGGLADCKYRRLRCIGNATERLIEDPRRIMRALRFIVQCDLSADRELTLSLFDDNVLDYLNHPRYRNYIVKELNKCLQYDVIRTMDALSYFTDLSKILFSEKGHNLNLLSNSKQRS